MAFETTLPGCYIYTYAFPYAYKTYWQNNLAAKPTTRHQLLDIIEEESVEERKLGYRMTPRLNLTFFV
jgi:hypothetical protein